MAWVTLMWLQEPSALCKHDVASIEWHLTRSSTEGNSHGRMYLLSYRIPFWRHLQAKVVACAVPH